VAGVQQPRQSWAQATVSAEASWQAGVQQAISDKRWARGVQQAGDQTWQAKTVQKGQSRFAEGVSQAQPDYQQGVAPYLQVIESVQLPPRGPKGDPRNIERVRVLAQALRARKLAAVGRSAAALFLAASALILQAGCAATVQLKDSPPNVQTELKIGG
jgi:hypothetical protein